MKGYAIKVHGQFIELYDDQEVTFTEESPILSKKTLPGIITLPALIPNVRHNRLIFGNLSDLQHWDYQEKFPAELYLLGSFYCKGHLILNDVTPKSFEFQFTEFDATEDFNNKKLADLDWPTFDLSVNHSDHEAPLPAFFSLLATRNQNNHLAPGTNANVTKDFVAPTIYNPAAIGSNEYKPANDPDNRSVKTPFQNLHVNQYDIKMAEADEGFFWDEKAYAYAINAISPFVFVRDILSRIFGNINFPITRNDLDDKEWHNLILYTNRAFTLYNMRVINFTLPPFDYEPTYNRSRAKPYESILRLAEYLPDVSITSFLTAIKNTFNLAFIPNRITNAVQILNKSKLISELSLFDISHDAAIYTRWSINSTPLSNLLLQWSNKINDEQRPYTHIYKGQVAQFSDLPTTAQNNDAIFVEQDNTLYQYIEGTAQWLPIYAANIQPSINHTPDHPQPEALNLNTDPAPPSGVGELDTYFDSAGIGNNFNGTYQKGFFVPTIQSPINTQSTAFNRQPSGNPTTANLILLLYRGMITSPASFQYPYASTDSREPFNFTNTNQHYQCTLNMYGERGIYQNFFQAWDEVVRKGRIVVIDLKPDVNKFKNLFNHTLYISGQKFLAQRKILKVTQNTIKSCQIEALQLLK